MPDTNMEMARSIAAAVERAGGRAYFVGGYVRDLLLGRENKDIDIEVHGIPAESLKKLLDGFGERLSVGAAFGIFTLRHFDLDIAMPRSETATGRGHRDFEIFTDPWLGTEKAAMRRDFTMNAMMQDVLTGEILDYFDGREDMKHGRIRHVNSKSFVEDPLRVFRAAQFAARFGFSVAPETVELASAMDVSALAGERVMEELKKALLKSGHPSIFFEELRRMNQLSQWFPEPEALIGIPQPETFHPEGDCWRHTMQVLDEAAGMRGQADQPLYFMLSALCHDLGKAVATERVNGAFHAYGHETAGIPLADRLLGRLTRERDLLKYVENMIELHMRPNLLVGQHSHVKSFMKLFDSSLNPGDLLLLAKADYLGRVGTGTDPALLLRSYGEIEKTLREMLALYRRRMEQPGVTGGDLIAAGLSPGPNMGEALAYAHKLHLAGLSKEDQLRHTLSFVRKQVRQPPSKN